MLLFVYEWVSGGGLLSHEGALPESLLTEGVAMAGAIAQDAAELADWEVALLGDLRVPQLNAHGGEIVQVDSPTSFLAAFADLCQRADAVVIIAPEIDGELVKAIRRAGSYGAKLISPDLEFASLAADKHRTAMHLCNAAIPTPVGHLLTADSPLPTDFAYPAVVKPVDGAGSQDTYVVAGPHEMPPAYVANRRIETLAPGVAASVAILCGPTGITALPPCRQRISNDGRLRYLGGTTPIESGLAARAQQLAVAAIGAMPPTQGYVGVDIILGACPDGTQDCVIEINPRLTTSYAGLRYAIEENLLRLMIAAAAGEEITYSDSSKAIEFGVDGCVSYSVPDKPF